MYMWAAHYLHVSVVSRKLWGKAKGCSLQNGCSNTEIPGCQKQIKYPLKVCSFRYQVKYLLIQPGNSIEKDRFQANCYENKLLCLVSNTIPLSETVRLGHSKTLKHLLMPISCHQFLIFGDALIPVRPVIHVKNVLKHLVTKVLLQKLWTLVGHLVDCFEGWKTTNTTISDSQAFLFWESPARYSQRMPS